MLNLRQEILAAGESPVVRQKFQRWLGVSDATGSSSRHDGSGGGSWHSFHNFRQEGDDGGDGAAGSAGGGGVDGSGGGGTGGEDLDLLELDACSDVALRLPGPNPDDPWVGARVLLGHNEDMTNDTLVGFALLIDSRRF